MATARFRLLTFGPALLPLRSEPDLNSLSTFLTLRACFFVAMVGLLRAKLFPCGGSRRVQFGHHSMVTAGVRMPLARQFAVARLDRLQRDAVLAVQPEHLAPGPHGGGRRQRQEA